MVVQEGVSFYREKLLAPAVNSRIKTIKSFALYGFVKTRS